MNRAVPVLLFLVSLFSTAIVSPITAGDMIDVYILAGQSNMDGRADVAELRSAHPDLARPNDSIDMWYASPYGEGYSTGWKSLAPGYSIPPGFGKGSRKLPSKTFGVEVSFGPVMAEAAGDRSVAIIKVSQGGTSLHTDWNPDAPSEGKQLYPLLIQTVELAIQDLIERGHQPRLAGLLWHQGESDSGQNNAKHYADRLHSMITQLRRDLETPDLPVLIGEVFDNGRRDRVRQAQQEAAERLPHAAFVSSQELTASDGTHFDTPSVVAFGQRFAQAMQELTLESTSTSLPAE